jgi:hypothetical protein
MLSRSFLVLSLVLFVSVLGLWVRSYVHFDSYGTLDSAGGTLSYLVSLRGGIQIAAAKNLTTQESSSAKDWNLGWFSQRLDSSKWTSGAPGDRWQVLNVSGNNSLHKFLGFRYASGGIGTAGWFWSIRVPLWSIALLCSLLPAIRLSKAIATLRRTRLGLCPKCGYDLRACPDRCPECGTPARTDAR